MFTNPKTIQHFSYWGDDNAVFTNLVYNRDSDILNTSNIEAIYEHLESAYNTDDIERVGMESFNHWAVGWVTRIVVYPPNKADFLSRQFVDDVWRSIYHDIVGFSVYISDMGYVFDHKDYETRLYSQIFKQMGYELDKFSRNVDADRVLQPIELWVTLTDDQKYDIYDEVWFSVDDFESEIIAALLDCNLIEGAESCEKCGKLVSKRTLTTYESQRHEYTDHICEHCCDELDTVKCAVTGQLVERVTANTITDDQGIEHYVLPSVETDKTYKFYRLPFRQNVRSKLDHPFWRLK